MPLTVCLLVNHSFVKALCKSDNETHQRAGASCVDFKTDPTAGSVACDGYAMFRLRRCPDTSIAATRTSDTIPARTVMWSP